MAAKKQTPLHKNYIAILAAVTLVALTYLISQQVLAAKSADTEYSGSYTSFDPVADNAGSMKNVGGDGVSATPIISSNKLPAGDYLVIVSAHISGANGCALSQDAFSPSATKSPWPADTNTDGFQFSENYSLQKAGTITLYCQGNGMQEGKIGFATLRLKPGND